MRVRSLARLVCPALLLTCAACATTGPPPGPEVDSIRLEGTQQLAAKDIKKKLVTSESGAGFWPFGQKAYFDPDVWQTDLRRIERFYEAQGYYQAEVVSDEVIPLANNRVSLKVEVKEGEPTTVARVDVTGLSELPEDVRAAALQQVGLERGEVFREEEWSALKEKVQATLWELGYAEASAGGEVAVDVDLHTAKVALEVQPGLRYRFGDIRVAPREHPVVGRERILAQVRGILEPGAWYAESALVEARGRVLELGVFSAVRVSRGPPDRQAQTVPIVIDVREAPFHTQKVGLGVGVDPSRVEGRVRGEYADRNFLGGLRRLSVRGKLGYAFLPDLYATMSETTVKAPGSGVLFDVVAELEQPHQLGRDLHSQVSIRVDRSVEQAYTSFGGTARAGVLWRPHPSLLLYPSYSFEAYRLTGTAEPGVEPPLLVTGGCQGQPPGQPCILRLSYFEQLIEWDRRDDEAEPRRGYYLALSLQEGGGPLGGSFTFFRALPDARFYTSFFEDRLTLAARVRLGTLAPAGGEPLDSPIVARFFSGGANAHRGFGTRRLSPQQVVPVAGAQPGEGGVREGKTVPVGGNGLFEASLELRYRLTERFVVAAFADAGFVTARQFDFTDARYVSRNLLYAFGVGVRYLTAVGPLRVDLAFRPDIGPPLDVFPTPGERLTYPVRTTCFGIGAPKLGYAGAPEGWCSFHVSIGEAF